MKPHFRRLRVANLSLVTDDNASGEKMQIANAVENRQMAQMLFKGYIQLKKRVHHRTEEAVQKIRPLQLRGDRRPLIGQASHPFFLSSFASLVAVIAPLTTLDETRRKKKKQSGIKGGTKVRSANEPSPTASGVENDRK